MMPSWEGPIYRLAFVLGLVAAIVAAGCDQELRKARGEGCSLNSECAAPLVCRLTKCRTECHSARDCPTGAQCVADADGFGACQLLEETSCALDSDCIAPLVCRSTSCTNECNADEDCPAGAECVEEGGARGCVDPAVDFPCDGDLGCMTNPEAPDFCVDGRCRVECLGDRDCRFDQPCNPGGGCGLRGSPSGMDASLPDGGTDAGMDAGDGSLDGGMDAGSMVADGGGDTGIVVDASTDVTIDVNPLDGFRCPPGPSSVTDVAVGQDHVCVLLADRTVRCFGSNASHQLGDPRVPPTAIRWPVQPTVSDVIAVEVGNNHSCALNSVGTLQCWGDNSSNQLGAGSGGMGVNPVFVQTPAGGATLTGVTALAAGGDTSCAVASAQAYCWGSNNGGVIGDGMGGLDRPRPSAVMGLGMATDIAVGEGRTACAIHAGAGWCWGIGGLGLPSGLPMMVLGTAGAVSVDVERHACGLTAAGGPACTGANNNGQLGNGTTTNSPIPVLPMVTALVREITTGVEFTCAALMTGAVFCWGNNLQQQLGDGTRMSRRTIPTPVVMVPPTVTRVDAARARACAVAGGDLWCWGRMIPEPTLDPTMMPILPHRVPCLP